MIRLLLGAAFLLVSLGLDDVSLRAAPPEGATPQTQLRSLDFLIGTWAGKGKMQGVGNFTDEYTFTWIMNRNFIQHQYAMRARDKVVWRDMGLIGWDADQKKLVGFTFGLDGSIGRGAAVESTKPDTYVMEGNTVGASPLKAWRTTFTKVDVDHLTTTLEIRDGDQYKPLMTLKYERQKPED